MAPLHLLEDRNRPQPRRRLQQRHDLGVEDVRQRVWPAAVPRLGLQRRWPGIGLEPIGRGPAERRLGRRHRRRVRLPELHVEPHLVIGDMAAGQGRNLSRGEDPSVSGRSRSPDATPSGSIRRIFPRARASGRATPSLRLEPSDRLSHPDCRASLILIVARQFGPRAEYAAMNLTLRERDDVHDADPWTALRLALQAGRITATGKYQGIGLSREIPAQEWDALDLVDSTRLNDVAGSDYVAASWTFGAGDPDDWWSLIRFPVREIISEFPASETPCASNLDSSRPSPADQFATRLKELWDTFGPISQDDAEELAKQYGDVTREDARDIIRKIGGNTRAGPISRTAEKRRLIRAEIARPIAPTNSRAARDGALARA